MKAITSIISTVLIALLCVSCNTSTTNNTTTITDKINTEVFNNNSGIDFQVVEVSGGSYGDTYSDKNMVIRNEKEYKAFWNKVYKNRTPTPERPSIDFSEEMLLFTIRETKPTGGYATKISKVVTANDQLAVKVTNTDPGDNCMTTQALTTPFQLVKVKKFSKSVKFYEETITQPCGT